MERSCTKLNFLFTTKRRKPDVAKDLSSPCNSKACDHSSPVMPATAKSPEKQNDPLEDEPHIISQSCSTDCHTSDTPSKSLLNNLSSTVKSLIGLLSSSNDEGCDELLNNEDGASMDPPCHFDQNEQQMQGFPRENFLDAKDPCKLATGTKTNPDAPSQSQSQKAEDKDQILTAQPAEISGLHDANVFHCAQAEDNPSLAGRKTLLNPM